MHHSLWVLFYFYCYCVLWVPANSRSSDETSRKLYIDKHHRRILQYLSNAFQTVFGRWKENVTKKKKTKQPKYPYISYNICSYSVSKQVIFFRAVKVLQSDIGQHLKVSEPKYTKTDEHNSNYLSYVYKNWIDCKITPLWNVKTIVNIIPVPGLKFW